MLDNISFEDQEIIYRNRIQYQLAEERNDYELMSNIETAMREHWRRIEGEDVDDGFPF